MKKKVLLSSILTIALCLSLIAGSTFALFTSTSKIDISVKAAKVEMTANISNLELYSVKADRNGTIKDEFGGSYKYDGPLAKFANGGTATFENATLTLDRITPGDKVSFDIEGANTSDVTIQYRYIIECIGDQKLMSGLLVTIEGVTYEYLGSYTSAWAKLEAGKDITAVPVVVEFPVNAGNEYQELTTKINVTVEAVQGNADVNLSAKPVVEFLDNITVDLAGKTFAGSGVGIVNTTKLDLTNGNIELDYVGFQNYGEATLTNVDFASGTSGIVAYGYAINTYDGGNTVLNNVNVFSANGVLAASNGSKLTVNGGSYVLSSANTSGRYVVYAEGEGTVVTINDGDFSIPAKLSNGQYQNNKRGYIYAGKGTTVIINGGSFAAWTPRTGYANIGGEGEVIITGGTFGFDPENWVADGYKTIKNGSNWYVVPENVNAIVSNATQLQEALDAATGEYVINVVGAIEGDVTATQKPDVKVTINGNGNTFAGVLLVDGKSATYTTAGLTINNFVFKADAISADACIRLGDGTNATRYTCNVTVNGCTFDVPGKVGVKSYTGGDKNVSIINCTATNRAHSLAQLKGVDGVVVDNCTVNAVRGINLNNSDNVTIKNSIFDVEKYAVRFGESNNSTVENYAVTNCTLTSDCAEGDAVIVLRAGATNANLDLTGTVINGTIEMTGYENANIVR